MKNNRVIVIGGGGAGSAAAQALHQSTSRLDVVVIGAEDFPPYNRTAVNKGLLSGAVEEEDIVLPGMELPGYTWKLGRTATALDPVRRRVELDDGSSFDADAVLIATGAAPRELPVEVASAAHDRVVSLRKISDTRRVRELTIASPSGSTLTVGAGLIGNEIADVLVGSGQQVILSDPSPLPMQKRLGRTVAEGVVRTHLSAGVDVRQGVSVSEVWAESDRLFARFDDGSRVMTDTIIVANGVTPVTGWLEGSGVPLQEGNRAGGILVDEHQRVLGMPGIYAAGDVAALPGPHGRPIRVEHWATALQQGRSAASSIIADLADETTDRLPPEELPLRLAPSCSTYVDGTKITVVGDPSAGVREQFVLGNPDTSRFAVAFLDTNDRAVGAVGVGGARAVNRLRSAIGRGATAAELTSDTHSEATGWSQ